MIRFRILMQGNQVQKVKVARLTLAKPILGMSRPNLPSLTSLLSYVPGTTKNAAVEETLLARDAILKEVRIQLLDAQNRMKQIYDRAHQEREFSPGDWVYLRLQNYRQQSVYKRLNKKLSPKFFGPYRVLAKVGPVAYKLVLPSSAKIHDVFHVSVLKKWVGTGIPVHSDLPILNPNEDVVLPQAVVDHRVTNGCAEILVHWQGCSLAEASWEDREEFVLRFPSFALEDNGNPKKVGVLRDRGRGGIA